MKKLLIEGITANENMENLEGWIFHPAIAQCIAARICCPFQRLALSQTCRAGRKYYWSEPLMRLWRQLTGLQAEETRWEEYRNNRKPHGPPGVLMRKNTAIGASIIAAVMNRLYEHTVDSAKLQSLWYYVRQNRNSIFNSQAGNVMPLVFGVRHSHSIDSFTRNRPHYQIEDDGFGDFEGRLEPAVLLQAACNAWNCKDVDHEHYSAHVLQCTSNWHIVKDTCRRLFLVENVNAKRQKLMF